MEHKDAKTGKGYAEEMKTRSCPVQNLCVFTTWGVT